MINPIPALPKTFGGQPEVVAALDEIRFGIDDESLAEFAWFAREYPRIFRYHIYHCEHRLETIHRNYAEAIPEFECRLLEAPRVFSISSGRGRAWEIYWDFESYLNACGAALDVFARIAGLFYEEQTPVSFSKLCAKRELTGPVDVLRAAQTRWVRKLKDYRDCFVHYTPVDNESYIHCHKYPSGWEVYCRLPVNPNARDTDSFRFSRRVELLSYSLTTYRHLMALDRKVGKLIRDASGKGHFPKRIQHLFSIGERQLRPANHRLQATAAGTMMSRCG